MGRVGSVMRCPQRDQPVHTASSIQKLNIGAGYKAAQRVRDDSQGSKVLLMNQLSQIIDILAVAV